MRFAVAIMSLGAGCRGLLGIDEGVVGTSDANVGDALVADTPGDASSVCYGVDPFRVCPGNSEGSGPIPTTIDTGGNGCDFVDTSNGRNWCVIVRPVMLLSGTITATGDRPLVLLSKGDLSLGLTAMIDVASHAGGATGAGARTECQSGNGTPNVQTGGGGGGGSFKTIGGRGGRGAPNFGVPGGMQGPAVQDLALRGGCSGGRGAPDTITNRGGSGGGAIYLLSSGTMLIEGLVNASGAGGGYGVAPGSGGGGGGAGGLIVLAATTLEVTSNAQVFANGGGGGGGAGNTTDSVPGEDPTSPQQGGTGGESGTGGKGGRGAANTSAGQTGNDDMAGGGGGGGGGGRVRVFALEQDIATGTVSPPPD